MKCKHCEDGGELFVPGRIIKCPYCQPVTNDEWRKTCSAEEFAEFLCRLLKGYDLRIGCLSLRTIINDEVEHGRNGNQIVVEWLKEKYNEHV